MKRLSLLLVPAALAALWALPSGAPATPTCVGATASPNLLWPPNHKFRLVTVTVPEGGEGKDPNVTTILSVTQDEPVNDRGDGNTAPDARRGPRPSDVHQDTVYLRAERSGRGDGRVYRITFQSKEGSGAQCTGSVTVGVPHDMGPPNRRQGGRVPRDSRQRYNSFGS